jgi:hypothetical protein
MDSAGAQEGLGSWETSYSLIRDHEGPRPAIEPVVLTEKLAEEKKKEEEPGFLRKYMWYIIGAVIVTQFLLPAPEEPPKK